MEEVFPFFQFRWNEASARSMIIQRKPDPVGPTIEGWQKLSSPVLPVVMEGYEEMTNHGFRVRKEGRKMSYR